MLLIRIFEITYAKASISYSYITINLATVVLFNLATLHFKSVNLLKYYSYIASYLSYIAIYVIANVYLISVFVILYVCSYI